MCLGKTEGGNGWNVGALLAEAVRGAPMGAWDLDTPRTGQDRITKECQDYVSLAGLELNRGIPG